MRLILEMNDGVVLPDRLAREFRKCIFGPAAPAGLGQTDIIVQG
jgi:hypothetical protein